MSKNFVSRALNMKQLAFTHEYLYPEWQRKTFIINT